MNPADQFEAIVNEHYEPLFKFAMSLTRAESDAQDLTQQTFYVWATKGHQLRDQSKAKTWLFTTLHRTFLKMRRTQTRYSPDDWEVAADESPVPSAELGDQMDSAHVLSALARVDEVYQAAVALFYLDDCSYKEIAVILDVPIGTVRSRISRGIAQLREIFLSEGSRDSSFARDGISVAAGSAKTDAPSKDAALRSRKHGQSVSGTTVCDYQEWVLSSIRLWEQLGAA